MKEWQECAFSTKLSLVAQFSSKSSVCPNITTNTVSRSVNSNDYFRKEKILINVALNFLIGLCTFGYL